MCAYRLQMAGDLSDCAYLAQCFESNASKIRLTVDEICKKYDREFPGDDVIELRHQKIICDRGNVKSMPTRRVGVATSDKHHRIRIDTPSPQSLLEDECHGKSPESEKTFISANCSRWVRNISEENEPSDAETISSDSEEDCSDSWEDESADTSVQTDDADFYFSGQDSEEDEKWLTIKEKKCVRRREAYSRKKYSYICGQANVAGSSVERNDLLQKSSLGSQSRAISSLTAKRVQDPGREAQQENKHCAASSTQQRNGHSSGQKTPQKHRSSPASRTQQRDRHSFGSKPQQSNGHSSVNSAQQRHGYSIRDKTQQRNEHSLESRTEQSNGHSSKDNRQQGNKCSSAGRTEQRNGHSPVCRASQNDRHSPKSTLRHRNDQCPARSTPQKMAVQNRVPYSVEPARRVVPVQLFPSAHSKAINADVFAAKKCKVIVITSDDSDLQDSSEEMPHAKGLSADVSSSLLSPVSVVDEVDSYSPKCQHEDTNPKRNMSVSYNCSAGASVQDTWSPVSYQRSDTAAEKPQQKQDDGQLSHYRRQFTPIRVLNTTFTVPESRSLDRPIFQYSRVPITSKQNASNLLQPQEVPTEQKSQTSDGGDLNAEQSQELGKWRLKRCSVIMSGNSAQHVMEANETRYYDTLPGATEDNLASAVKELQKKSDVLSSNLMLYSHAALCTPDKSADKYLIPTSDIGDDVDFTPSTLYETTETPSLIELKQKIEVLSRTVTPKKNAELAFNTPTKILTETAHKALKESHILSPPKSNENSKTDRTFLIPEKPVFPNVKSKPESCSPCKPASSIITWSPLASPFPLVKIESQQQWTEVKRKYHPVFKSFSTEEILNVLEMPNSESVIKFVQQKYCKSEPQNEAEKSVNTLSVQQPAQPTHVDDKECLPAKKVPCNSKEGKIKVNSEFWQLGDHSKVQNPLSHEKALSPDKTQKTETEIRQQAFSSFQTDGLSSPSRTVDASDGKMAKNAECCGQHTTPKEPCGIFRASPGETIRQSITSSMQESASKQTKEDAEAECVVIETDSFSLDQFSSSAAKRSNRVHGQKTAYLGSSSKSDLRAQPDPKMLVGFLADSSPLSSVGTHKTLEQSQFVLDHRSIGASPLSPTILDGTQKMSGSAIQQIFTQLKKDSHREKLHRLQTQMHCSQNRSCHSGSQGHLSNKQTGVLSMEKRNVPVDTNKTKFPSKERQLAQERSTEDVLWAKSGGAKQRSHGRGRKGACSMNTLSDFYDDVDLSKKERRLQQVVTTTACEKLDDKRHRLTTFQKTHQNAKSSSHTCRSSGRMAAEISHGKTPEKTGWNVVSPSYIQKSSVKVAGEPSGKKTVGKAFVDVDFTSETSKSSVAVDGKLSKKTVGTSAYSEKPSFVTAAKPAPDKEWSYNHSPSKNGIMQSNFTMQTRSDCVCQHRQQNTECLSGTCCNSMSATVHTQPLNASGTPSKLISNLNLSDVHSPTGMTRSCDALFRLQLQSPPGNKVSASRCCKPSCDQAQSRHRGTVQVPARADKVGSAGQSQSKSCRVRLDQALTEKPRRNLVVPDDCSFESGSKRNGLCPTSCTLQTEANQNSLSETFTISKAGHRIFSSRFKSSCQSELTQMKDHHTLSEDLYVTTDSTAGNPRHNQTAKSVLNKLQAEDSSHVEFCPVLESEGKSWKVFRSKNRELPTHTSPKSAWSSKSKDAFTPVAASEWVFSKPPSCRGTNMVRISSPQARQKNTRDHIFSFNSTDSFSANARTKRSFESDRSDADCMLGMDSCVTRSPCKRRRINTILSTSTPSKSTGSSPSRFGMDESLSTISGENSDLNSTVQSTDNHTLHDLNTLDEEEDDVTLLSE